MPQHWGEGQSRARLGGIGASFYRPLWDSQGCAGQTPAHAGALLDPRQTPPPIALSPPPSDVLISATWTVRRSVKRDHPGCVEGTECSARQLISRQLHFTPSSNLIWVTWTALPEDPSWARACWHPKLEKCRSAVVGLPHLGSPQAGLSRSSVVGGGCCSASTHCKAVPTEATQPGHHCTESTTKRCVALSHLDSAQDSQTRSSEVCGGCCFARKRTLQG